VYEGLRENSLFKICELLQSRETARTNLSTAHSHARVRSDPRIHCASLKKFANSVHFFSKEGGNFLLWLEFCTVEIYGLSPCFMGSAHLNLFTELQKSIPRPTHKSSEKKNFT
jgi:hypothetical protein